MAKKRRTLRRNKRRSEVETEEEAVATIPEIKGEDSVVSLDEVRPNKFNYNRQSNFIFEKMQASLQEFGFVDPILVRSGNEEGAFGYFEIIGGEHRHKAAAALGYDRVPIRDIGHISDVQAKKLCIVLNETKGRPDNDALAALITDLNGEVGLHGLEVLPYDESELSAFLDMASSDDGWDEDLGEDDAGLDPGSSGVKKETIISVMGLLDVSKNKEQLLIAQWKNLLELLSMKGKPVRAFEKIMNDAMKRYGS